MERAELFINKRLNYSQDFSKSNSQKPSCLFLFHLLRLEAEMFVHFQKLFVPSEEIEFFSIMAEFTSEKGGQICHYQRGQNYSYFSNRRDPSVNLFFQEKDKFVLASLGVPYQS